MPVSNLAECILWGEDYFNQSELCFGHGMDNAYDEAAYLALFTLDLALDLSVEHWQAIKLDDSQVAQIQAIMQRRVDERKPAAYLTHQGWFAGKAYYVDERVLVPRSPFAELILNEFVPWVKQEQVRRILEIGTGSGCMAIACADVFPQAEIDAVDLSMDAIAVAKKNAAYHGVEQRVHIIHSDLFAALQGRQYDLIISNPPYVDRVDMQQRAQEFQHEPDMALAAGDDGLDIVSKILEQAGAYMQPGACLIVEVGNSQQALDEAYPTLPFIWLEFEHGGHGVFVLEKEQLPHHD